MKKLSFLILTVFCVLGLHSQPKSFELSNPNAIELTGNNLEHLLSTYWRIQKIDTKMREQLIDTKVYGSIEYSNDGTFKYSGSNGNWQLLESKFIKHQLEDNEDERRFNFGGIYCATELTDSTLVLTKIFTSTNDMSRTIYLRKYDKNKAAQPVPFVYTQPMNEKTIDSLSSLSMEELFISGFNFRNDTILIQTPDSLYRIKRRATNKR